MSNEKGSAPNANFEKCSFVLVDILGTTTSHSFAKDSLFPYITKNVEEVLKAKWNDDSVKLAVKQLREGEEIELDAAVKLVTTLTEQSSENIGLKTIQGMVTQKGYETGDLKAHIFPDVPKAFEFWTRSRKVAVYSTGSVESQKQLFANSVEGDVSVYISKYFDQSVGPKTETDSYRKIVEQLAVEPDEVVFVTDLIEEAKAAKNAGLSVAIITRNGDAREEECNIPIISTFENITFENSSKRKNTDEPPVTEIPPSKVAKIQENVDNEKLKELKDDTIDSESTNSKEKVGETEKNKDEDMDVDAPEEIQSNEEATEKVVAKDVPVVKDTVEKDTTEIESQNEDHGVELKVVKISNNEKVNIDTKEAVNEKQVMATVTDCKETCDTPDKKSGSEVHSTNVDVNGISPVEPNKGEGQEIDLEHEVNKCKKGQCAAMAKPEKIDADPEKVGAEPKKGNADTEKGDASENEVKENTAVAIKDESASGKDENTSTVETGNLGPEVEREATTTRVEKGNTVSSPKEIKETTLANNIVSSSEGIIPPSEPVKTSTKAEESPEVKLDEEKENNQDIANGLKTVEKETKNSIGEASGPNGRDNCKEDNNGKEQSNEKDFGSSLQVDEMNVKKVDAPVSSETVSVEV